MKYVGGAKKLWWGDVHADKAKETDWFFDYKEPSKSNAIFSQEKAVCLRNRW